MPKNSLKLELQPYLDNKYIAVQKHPDYDLFIYNYTQKVQYEAKWDEVTTMTRGLVLDIEGNIIARPLPKFFNTDQVGGMPSNQIIEQGFEVYEKLDGSLGIMFYWDNQWNIATRGSFASEQAIFASDNLMPIYADFIKDFDTRLTYIMEIIYPSNRIVVDYADSQRLVLLGVIDTVSGQEIDIRTVNYPDKAKLYDGLADFDQIKSLENHHEEGFVIRFRNGHRAKFKFSEYKRLHKILTNVTNRTVWEYLREGREFDELLERVPDEFYTWLKSTKLNLQTQYQQKITQLEGIIQGLDKSADRKSLAKVIATSYPKDAKYLFGLIDGRDITDQIWRDLKPVFGKPFKSEEA